MRKVLTVNAVVLSLCTAGPAAAQSFELRRPSVPPAAAAQIVGGYKAAVANWPATFIFDVKPGEFCTATAIGPRVILTAGHCLEDGAMGKIRGTAITLWCDKPANDYFDIALCASSGTIQIARNKPYESVGVVARPDLGAPLAMLGFGCTRAGGDGGVLYEGDATIGSWDLGERRFKSRGVPALCSGDSGGGAYSPPGTDRRIVGVASNVLEGESRFTLLSHPKVVGFIKEWQAKQRDSATQQPVEARVCGIDGTTAYCRG